MSNPTDRVEIITSVQRRRRWTAAEKVRMVEETFEPGMTDVVPARHLGNDRLGRQALLHHPQLLSKRPPPSLIRTGKHRHRVCPLICKSMSKPLTAKRDHRLITGAPIIERLRSGHIDYGSSSSC